MTCWGSAVDRLPRRKATSDDLGVPAQWVEQPVYQAEPEENLSASSLRGCGSNDMTCNSLRVSLSTLMQLASAYGCPAGG
jgi:hypothetical protein